MIRFSKLSPEGMDAFRNAIREQIIEMASEVISPIYGDWDRFDEEIAKKLDAEEIDFDEANKKFVEDFYKQDLDNLTIDKNTIVFNDAFNVEGTLNDGSYNLDAMVTRLQELYPDVEVFGIGYIDYHYSAIIYILIANEDSIVFSEDENDGELWISNLYMLAKGETVEEKVKYYDKYYDDEFTIEKLREDMTNFISRHNLNLTVMELLDKLGLVHVKKLFK